MIIINWSYLCITWHPLFICVHTNTLFRKQEARSRPLVKSVVTHALHRQNKQIPVGVIKFANIMHGGHLIWSTPTSSVFNWWCLITARFWEVSISSF